MAETGTDAQQPAQQPQVRMNILSQYIKDLSFENILARKPAEGNVQPDVKVQVGLDANRRASGENHYEVVIKAKAATLSEIRRSRLSSCCPCIISRSWHSK